MTEPQNTAEPTVPGPYISAQQTEASPLKQSLLGSTRKSLVNWLWGWDFSLESAGSLKSIVTSLFLTAAVVTFALITQIYHNEYQVPMHGAVSTDHPQCTEIGVEILKKGGHAVDAAVAAAFCMGVVHFHVTGLGGGGLLLGYNQRKQQVFDVVDFMSSVPASVNPATLDLNYPGQTVGVPGFVAGLWTAHQTHGQLPWSDLVMPSVQLAREGFTVSTSLATASTCLQPGHHGEDLADLLVSLVAGGNVSLPRLAATLELIAAKGANVLYNGSFQDQIQYTVKVGNGSLSESDVSQYSVVTGMSQKADFYDFDIVVPASSFGGTFLLNFLQNIQILELTPDKDSTADVVRKISDAIYDTQMDLSGKTPGAKPISSPAGSSIAVIDSNDNYVSVVTTLNSILGSQLLTELGFILNDALVNGGFDNNGRPTSMVTPVVAVKRGKICGQRIVAGAPDARSLAQVLVRLINFKQPVNDSVEAPRFHIDNIPRSIFLEDHHDPQLSAVTVSALKGMKMAVNSQEACISAPPGSVPYSGINVVAKFFDDLSPYADSRESGLAIQF